MSDKPKYDPPKETWGDHSHLSVRAGLSALPAIGGPALEFFNKFVAPPIQKRNAEWMNSVATALRDHEATVAGLADRLKSDEFVDTFLQASQAAIKTSRQEKLTALRNAVLNAALPSSPNADLQSMFVALIDQFTPLHLTLLKLAKTIQRERDKTPFTRVFEDKSLPSGLANACMNDLYSKKLIMATRDIYGGTLSSVSEPADVAQTLIPHSISDLGQRFLIFIAAPKIP